MASLRSCDGKHFSNTFSSKVYMMFSHSFILSFAVTFYHLLGGFLLYTLTFYTLFRVTGQGISLRIALKIKIPLYNKRID